MLDSCVWELGKFLGKKSFPFSYSSTAARQKAAGSFGVRVEFKIVTVEARQFIVTVRIGNISTAAANLQST